MCLWAKPDRLAKLGITVPEIVSAIQSQDSVNPAGQVGSEPIEEWNDGRQSRRRRLRARKAEQRCRCQAGFVLRNIEIGFVKRQRLDEVGVPLQYLAHLLRNSPIARKIRGQEYAFGECGERAGLRHDRVGKVASHGIGDAAQTAQSDAVGPLGMFEFLNGLPWRAGAC